MKQHFILIGVATLSLGVLTQCSQQQLATPNTKLVTAGTHRDVVEGWIVNMEEKARVMEDISGTNSADAAASRIRSINSDIRQKQALIEAPVTKEQYAEVMNLPEFSTRIESVKKRVANARARLSKKGYYKSEALRAVL